jgi:Flp pilus assembly protein TadG
VLVAFVLVLSVLLGCCGLALDIGLLELKQVQLQNAADAAALGASFQMEREEASTSASAIADYTTAAVAEAGQNGFVNNVNGVKVVVNMPPTTGLYTANQAAVMVTVSQPVSTIFKSGSYTIAAKATGVVPPCVYFMSPSTSYYTVRVQNNTHVDIGCAWYARWSGYTDGGTVASFDAAYFGGPSTASSFSGTVAAGSQGYSATFNAPAQSDPLSYLVSPSPPANAAACNPLLQNENITSSKTLNPGIYCGTFTISGAGTTVTFNPGVYIIAGSVNWSAATINGTGVTLFLTKVGGTANYGTFTVGTNTRLSLYAPTSGSLTGVVIFGDRNWVTSSAAQPPQDISFSGATLNIDGIVYLTNTGMSFANGTLTSPNYFGLVVGTLTLSGATFTTQGNYSGLSGGSPYRPGVGLAE